MRRLALTALFLLAVSFQAFGHAGEVHKYMGTVTSVRDDGSFAMKTTDGKTVDVSVSKTTEYRDADGHYAKHAELQTGKRVVVTVSKDGRTASAIKFARTKAAAK